MRTQDIELATPSHGPFEMMLHMQVSASDIQLQSSYAQRLHYLATMNVALQIQL
jgi:hypothetical protein